MSSRSVGTDKEKLYIFGKTDFYRAKRENIRFIIIRNIIIIII